MIKKLKEQITYADLLYEEPKRKPHQVIWAELSPGRKKQCKHKYKKTDEKRAYICERTNKARPENSPEQAEYVICQPGSYAPIYERKEYGRL